MLSLSVRARQVGSEARRRQEVRPRTINVKAAKPKRKFRGLKWRRKHEGIKGREAVPNRQLTKTRGELEEDHIKLPPLAEIPHSALDSSSTSRRCENILFRARYKTLQSATADGEEDRQSKAPPHQQTNLVHSVGSNL